MAEFIMVACDLHDKTMLLKIARGCEASEKLTLANTATKRRGLIEQLHQRARAAGGAKIIFAYEASGLGFGLHDELTAAGIACHVLAPTKIARSTQHRQRKTDERDAEEILQLLRGHVLAGNPLPGVWIPRPQTRADRDLVRARLDVAEKQGAVRVQIRCLLKRSGLVRPKELKSAWSKKASAWLWMVTRDPQVDLGIRHSLASLLRQLEFLESETDLLDETLHELATAPRYAAQVAELTQLSGVGELTALVFLTELGDLTRFENRRQIGAYLGLVPRSYESGAAGDRKGHITRQGQARVRRVLCQAAWTRIIAGGCDRAAYERVAEKNPKHKKVAVVAAMRRLGIRMWHRALAAQTEAPPCVESCRTATPAPASG